GESETWKTGTSARGHASTSGTHAPWSRPRSRSSHENPAARSIATVLFAASGAPRAGYFTCSSSTPKPKKSCSVAGFAETSTAGRCVHQWADATTMKRGAETSSDRPSRKFRAAASLVTRSGAPCERKSVGRVMELRKAGPGRGGHLHGDPWRIPARVPARARRDVDFASGVGAHRVARDRRPVALRRRMSAIGFRLLFRLRLL